MNLPEKFNANWKQYFSHFTSVNCHLLLAVSGGIDSIVLTELVAKSGFDFTIAHCNFQLRGEESLRDEMFVLATGEKYQKKVLIKKFDTETFAEENKLSIQEAARNLRYQWFEEIVNGQWMMDNVEKKIINYQLSTVNCIVTAHHANDNIETLLINFFRGTGISGLHGILPQQGNIIRPLLFAKRKEIENYAKENNLKWVEDSSNESDKYTRNFFRHKIIPSVKEVFPNAEDNLLHNIERFKETEELYQQAIHQHKKKLVEQKGNEFHIPVLKLKKISPLNSVLREIIKEYNFSSSQADEIKKLMDAESGSYVASVSHRVFKNRNWLIIAPLQTEKSHHILIEEKDKKIFFENGLLILEELSIVNYQLSTADDIASLDAEKIQFPLLLRKWKQGDYFYPLGMEKKKKLSRFFIDQKLSVTEKENVWVIEMNKKIIWIVGYRIDNRFKINSSTKNILKISFIKK